MPTVPVVPVVPTLEHRAPVPSNDGFTHDKRNVRPRGGAPLPGGGGVLYMNPSRKIFQKIFIKKFPYSGPVACAFGVLTLLSKVG